MAVWVAVQGTSAQRVVCSPFRPDEVRLLPSRFADNRQRDSLWMASIPVDRLLHSFRNTAGLFSALEGGYDAGMRLGGWESPDCDLRGHTTGHLLSAMAWLRMDEKADSLVKGLAEVQQHYGTGYLAAFGEGLIDRNLQGKSVWAPFYTLHKLLQGLLDQYEIAGNQEALPIAEGMARWAYNKLKDIGDEQRRRMINNEFGGFNEAMYRLYAITGNADHLWLARFFYHNDKIDPLKQGNDNLGTYHANTFIPKLLGECSNYELFGDADSRAAATLLFSTLTQKHAFATGEVSDHEHLFDPNEQASHLTGYDGENCCTYNLLKLADRLFSYEPRSSIADYYERALYNHILGQQDTLSSMVCYFTPLQTGAHRLYSTRDSSFWCCVGSGFESHARYQSSIYFHTADELYVNLFIPSEVTFQGMTLRQETCFPEKSTTRLSFRAPMGTKGSLRLKVRYPSWATMMKVNGRRVKAGADGYVALTLGRKPLDIELGMALREQAATGDSSRVALVYGPIVLAGRLAEVGHPFSDPRKHNDYYTYDFGRHADVVLGEVSHVGGLRFKCGSIDILPFYNLQRHRYVVYWKKQ